MTQTKRLNCTQHLLRYIDIQHSITSKGTILQRIRRVLGLGQIFGGEGTAIDNHQPTFYQIMNIGDQCSRIHGNQHVQLITGGSDIFSTKINLKRGYAEGSAYRRPDLGREIGKS